MRGIGSTPTAVPRRATFWGVMAAYRYKRDDVSVCDEVAADSSDARGVLPVPRRREYPILARLLLLESSSHGKGTL